MPDFLNPENCNKTHCKSCIFHPIVEKRIGLSNSRVIEIEGYLSRMESSHVCHNTGKTCYGGLEFQAKILFKIGIIEKNSVDCLLQTANKTLNDAD